MAFRYRLPMHQSRATVPYCKGRRVCQTGSLVIRLRADEIRGPFGNVQNNQVLDPKGLKQDVGERRWLQGID